MALEPQPPSGQTLTRVPNSIISQTKKPPDPPTPMLITGNTPAHTSGNPFGGTTPMAAEEVHRRSLDEAISEARAPFQYKPTGTLTYIGANVGSDTQPETFNTSVNLLIETLAQGFHSPQTPAALSTTDWAKLSCALLSAIGRGYCTEYSRREPKLEKVRLEAPDPNPLGPKYPTLFHCLAATATQLESHLGVDQEEYIDWYSTLRESFIKKTTKAAAAEVEEKWQQWKADQIDRRAAAQELEISTAVRNRNVTYFLSAAAKLGLRPSPQIIPPSHSTPTTGRKRSVSGSTPGAGQGTPAIARAYTAQTTKSTPSPHTTPRGRTTTPAARRATRTDPSPTPQPKLTSNNTQAFLNLSPKVTLNLGPRKDNPQPPKPSLPDDHTPLAAAIQAAMAPFMVPLMARIDALERTSMPPPARASTRPPTRLSDPGAQPDPPTSAPDRDNDFTLVSRNGRNKKGKGKATTNGQAPAQTARSNITPISYADAATTAANIQQPPLLPK